MDDLDKILYQQRTICHKKPKQSLSLSGDLELEEKARPVEFCDLLTDWGILKERILRLREEQALLKKKKSAAAPVTRIDYLKRIDKINKV